MLFTIVDILDKNDIEYHLEGGTLLGIVRDGDLLPWDHDIDLSIDISDAEKLVALQKQFWKRGFKFSVRKSEQSYSAIKEGQYRILKVKSLAFNILASLFPNYRKNAMIGDIFIKVSDNEYTYWQAKNKILRVNNTHYNGHDTIKYMGKKLKTPKNYNDYLTAKYGNWSKPIKEWSCDVDEKTVCA